MRADGWISASALPLFSLPHSTVVLHPRQEARSRGADFMAASVGLDRKLERGAKRGGDTFHPFPLTVPSVYALHVCGLVALAVLCLSVPPFLFQLMCIPLMSSPFFCLHSLYFTFWLRTTMRSNSRELKFSGFCYHYHNFIQKMLKYHFPAMVSECWGKQRDP